jgi:hypothetical protein
MQILYAGRMDLEDQRSRFHEAKQELEHLHGLKEGVERQLQEAKLQHTVIAGMCSLGRRYLSLLQQCSFQLTSRSHSEAIEQKVQPGEPLRFYFVPVSYILLQESFSI